MVVYHFDRSGNLKENSWLSLIHTPASPLDPTVSLYGFDVVSHWGEQCYNCLFGNSPSNMNDMNSLQIELQAETIRKSFYPHMPSRFKSIFAVKKLDDFKLWKEYLHVNPESHVYEIALNHSTCFQLDAYFLKGGIDCDPITQSDTLLKYWSGTMSTSPLPELLIQLPVFISRRVPRSELVF